MNQKLVVFLGSHDDDPSREKRLRIVQEILVYHKVTSFIGLHDHKGVLAINWFKPPNGFDLDAANAAWSAMFEHEIEHYVRGEPMKPEYSVDPFR